MSIVKTLRLAVNDLERKALECESEEALEHIDEARKLINDIEKDFDELSKLGITFQSNQKIESGKSTLFFTLVLRDPSTAMKANPSRLKFEKLYKLLLDNIVR